MDENPATDTALAREDFSQADAPDAEREDVSVEDASPSAPGPPLADWSGVSAGAVSPGQDNFLERVLARPASPCLGSR